MRGFGEIYILVALVIISVAIALFLNTWNVGAQLGMVPKIDSISAVLRILSITGKQIRVGIGVSCIFMGTATLSYLFATR